ncbi:unnamed protein product [Haemonchus placei]|uniref:INCENP_ARK-bind domain-containing protein n=1 Tax=Haemonchus placei TaxID=6290 RepID=A0A0N4W354_HAEPC|nr:unnamed protein product [Haemonchus placei]
MRAHALIYSPDVAAKRKTFHVTAQAPVQKEVSEEERVRRAEKKREKKLLSKQSDEEVRRLELLRKEKEREERRLKREEEKRRQEELEYQKWQEMQKKKEEKLQREAAEREAAEKKAAEEAKKAREAQLAAEKEKAKKAKKAAENEKKAAESEKLTKTTVSVDKTSPPEQPVAPAAKKVEEEVWADSCILFFDLPEKKKKKKEKEQSVEKEAPVKVSNAVETSPPVVEDEKQSKKKGGKTKKTSESDSGFHNGEHDTVLSNDVEDEKTHGKHNETHGKKNKKSKKSEGETIEVANGHITHNVFNQPDHVIDSAPLGNVPDAGFVQVDGEKKKGNKGKKHEKDAQLSMGETDEVSLKKNKQKEKKGKQASPTTTEVPKVEVVTELTKDANQSAPSATKSPPIQVHEVTSTANVNGMKETSHTSSTTTSPTQFAQNVEKLISHTMHRSRAEIIEIDPNVKVTIDHQLAKLAERKTESSEPKILITPLPIELHYSRPTTPSNRERVYKLLPKDIIFCSGLLDSHGENYAAMAADPRNIYKENARAIQRKMRIFKESPHYQTYLRAKEEGKTVEEVLADEGQM